MEVEELKTITKQISTRWKQVDFLEKEIDKVNLIHVVVGERQVNFKFTGNQIELWKSASKKGRKKLLFDSLTISKIGKKYKLFTDKEAQLNLGFSAVSKIGLLNSNRPIPINDSEELKEVLRIAILEMTGEDVDEKKLKEIEVKALNQWAKVNVLEKELARLPSVEFVVNEKEVEAKFPIETGILRLQRWELTAIGKVGDTFAQIKKIGFPHTSLKVERGERDQYKRIYDGKELSNAINFAVETIVAPACFKRKLNREFDTQSYYKTHPYIDEAYIDERIFASPREWEKILPHGGSLLSYGENSVFCFLGAGEEEGILFDLVEGDLEKRHLLDQNYFTDIFKDPAAGQVYRFRIPQTLDKIYNLEYKTLNQTTHCCGTKKALLIQSESEDLNQYEKVTFETRASLLHKMSDFDKTLKDSMDWMLSELVMVNDPKTSLEHLKFEGIIAVPGGRAEKMNFAAVFVQKEKNKTRQTFIRPISSKGNAMKENRNYYKKQPVYGGLGLANRVDAKTKVSKEVVERIELNIKKAQKASFSNFDFLSLHSL